MQITDILFADFRSFWELFRQFFADFAPQNHRKPKGDGGKGTGKKLSRPFATNVTTIYDILRRHLLGIPSEQGFLMAWQYVSRKGGGKGWNSGVQRPALAINDSNAKFNLSACPIHLHQASPRGARDRERADLPRGRARESSLPPGTKKSQPQARGGKSRTDNGGSEMSEVSEHLQLDNQSGLPLVRPQTSPGECPQSTPFSEKRWPGQCEDWWGWIRMRPTNRTGRLMEHTLQPAKLPPGSRNDLHERVSGW